MTQYDEVKIEKGIEMPRINSKNSYYPYEKMEVGDSFYIEVKEGENMWNVQSRLLTSSKSFILKNNLQWKFTTRKMDKGFRIWRIK